MLRVAGTTRRKIKTATGYQRATFSGVGIFSFCHKFLSFIPHPACTLSMTHPPPPTRSAWARENLPPASGHRRQPCAAATSLLCPKASRSRRTNTKRTGARSRDTNARTQPSPAGLGFWLGQWVRIYRALLGFMWVRVARCSGYVE